MKKVTITLDLESLTNHGGFSQFMSNIHDFMDYLYSLDYKEDQFDLEIENVRVKIDE